MGRPFAFSLLDFGKFRAFFLKTVHDLFPICLFLFSKICYNKNKKEMDDFNKARFFRREKAVLICLDGFKG